MRTKSGILTFVLISIASAANPVGTVSSNASFQLHGSNVPVDGVPSWPIGSGDEIATNQGRATLHLKDGTEAVLDTGSSATVESTGDRLSLKLKRGAIQVKVGNNSKIQVLNGNSLISAKPGEVTQITSTSSLRVATFALLPPPPPPPPGPISAR